MVPWANPRPQTKWHLSVQPFLQGSLVWQTDWQIYRPTDHATRSVTIGRIYVRSTAMWPNNQQSQWRRWTSCRTSSMAVDPVIRLSNLNCDGSLHTSPTTCVTVSQYNQHPSTTSDTRQPRPTPVNHVWHPSTTPDTHEQRPTPINHVSHPSTTSNTHQPRPTPVNHVRHPSTTSHTHQPRPTPIKHVRHPSTTSDTHQPCTQRQHTCPTNLCNYNVL